MAIAAIIGAVVAIGGAVVGGILDSQDTAEANRIGLKLAETQRQDKLNTEKAQEKLNMLGLKQRKEEFSFQRKEARLDRKEREKDRQYAKRQNFKAENLDFVNKNATARNAFLNSVRRAT